jgi:hypothetical protein
MKPSELRKLIQEYPTLKAIQEKSYNHHVSERLKEIKHRYYHETGNDMTTK